MQASVPPSMARAAVGEALDRPQERDGDRHVGDVYAIRATDEPGLSAPLIGPLCVRHVMTRTVFTIAPDAFLRDAVQLMRTHRISGLPVTDEGGSVVGIVSESDVRRVVRERVNIDLPERPSRSPEFPSEERRDQLELFRWVFDSVRVGDVMTSGAICVPPELPLETAARIMQERRINRLPVLDTGTLVGIVARADAVFGLLSRSTTPHRKRTAAHSPTPPTRKRKPVSLR